MKHYGFTLKDGNEASSKIITSDASGNATWYTPVKKITITYLDFINAALTSPSIPGEFHIATLPGAVISVLKAKHSIAFASPALSDAAIGISSASRASYLGSSINSLNVFGAPSNTVGVEGTTDSSNITTQTILNQSLPDVLKVTLTLTSDSVFNLSAGSIDIWYTETICI